MNGIGVTIGVFILECIVMIVMRIIIHTGETITSLMMLLFNGDVEMTAESIDWVVFGVKAMDYYYFIKIPRWLKEKAESSKEELKKELILHDIKFEDLVIEITKYKAGNYKAEIETKAYETKNYPSKTKEQLKKAEAKIKQSSLF